MSFPISYVRYENNMPEFSPFRNRDIYWNTSARLVKIHKFYSESSFCFGRVKLQNIKQPSVITGFWSFRVFNCRWCLNAMDIHFLSQGLNNATPPRSDDKFSVRYFCLFLTQMLWNWRVWLSFMTYVKYRFFKNICLIWKILEKQLSKWNEYLNHKPPTQYIPDWLVCTKSCQLIHRELPIARVNISGSSQAALTLKEYVIFVKSHIFRCTVDKMSQLKSKSI